MQSTRAHIVFQGMRRPTKRLSKKDKPWQPPCAFRGDADPQVVARIEPAPVFSPITEPLLLVHGLDGRDPLKWIIETEPVQQLIESIKVHTKSLIVRKNGKNEKEKEWIRTKSKPKIYHESPVVHPKSNSCSTVCRNIRKLVTGL